MKTTVFIANLVKYRIKEFINAIACNNINFLADDDVRYSV